MTVKATMNGRLFWRRRSPRNKALEICAQLSAQIERSESIVEAKRQASGSPEALRHVRTGKRATKASIQTMVSRLRSHEEILEGRAWKLISSNPPSKETAEELERLQATRDSICQCIRVLSDANEDTTEIERHNVFEDITLADSSYFFTVSTVGDLVTAKRVNLTSRSYSIGG